MAEAPKAQAMIGGGKSIGVSRAERHPKRKHLKHMRIGKAENGGFHVEHEYATGPDMPYEQPTEHVFGKAEGGKLLDHVKRHLRISSVVADGEPGKVLGKALPAGHHKAAKAPHSEPKADDMDGTSSREADEE